MKKQVIRINENQVRKIVLETAKKILKEHNPNMRQNSLWEAFEVDGYETYDKFVDFIKNYYSPQDDQKAYEIEDKVNGMLGEMFSELDSLYWNN